MQYSVNERGRLGLGSRVCRFRQRSGIRMLTEPYATRLEGTLVVLLVEDVQSVDVKARFSANPLVLEVNVFRSELWVITNDSRYNATG